MAPSEEKLGDAITVKTPLPPLYPSSEKKEKKQLPDKKTARKTASSSKSKQSPSVTRTSGSRSSLDRVSVGDAASLDQRPPKRPRLSNDVDKPGLGSHHVSSFAESISHLSSVTKPASPEEHGLGSVASDFALRPKKENSSSLEMPPRPKPRDAQCLSTTKSSHKPPVRKQQGPRDTVKNLVIPTHGVIDLTLDDDPRPESSSTGHQASHADTRKDRERPTAEPPARVGQVISDLPRGGKSIEVQTKLNQGTVKSNENVDASNQDGQSHARKEVPNLAPRPAPKKAQNINIAPRPVKTPLPPDYPFGSRPSQSKLDNDKQKAPQYHRSLQPTIGKPKDVPRQNGAQAVEPVPMPGLELATALNLASNLHVSTASTTPVSSTSLSKPSPNGHRAGSEFMPSAQTNDVRPEIIEHPKASHTTNVNGAPPANRVSNLDASLSQPEPMDVAGRTRRSQSKESSLSKTQSIPESHVVNSHTSSAQSPEAVGEILQSSMELSSGARNHNEVKKLVSTPAVESSFGSILEDQDQSWKCSKPEANRQKLISKHDPKKFDSYIYGKSNEPFRPSSASFSLPPWLQPPRPTRPATHFAHIDPRIHWTHSRSKKWHREKQEEINERGNRKVNFGQAAARAAKRKREKGHLIADLPERVKNNPQWLAALEELDVMAEQYHAQRREKFKERKERRQQEESLMNVRQKEKERGTILIDEDGDYEMGEDPSD
ncbi:hypothetical protein F4781DRAFT_224277 [Annulohypoxylon bovei var. microspora]|nr:hypothetical protein F4781DRAFT_224277 [Annulohypoxylon bovei var. microspora]